MAERTNNGPPQEGLDPKLAILTDLAPVAHPPLTETGRGRATYKQQKHTTTTLTSVLENEGPPQKGLDPKLVVCVNDGEGNTKKYRAEEHSPRIPQIDRVDVGNGVHAHAPQPSYDSAMPGPNVYGNVRTAVLQFSSKANVATTTNMKQQQFANAIHTPSKRIKSSDVQQTKSNPILASPESLSAWNQTHSLNREANYNHDSSRKNQQVPVSSVSKQEKQHFANHQSISSRDKLCQSVHNTASNALPSDGKLEEPLVNCSASYSAAPRYNTTSQLSGSKGNSNFWLQEEEERFLLGLRLYGWGQVRSMDMIR